jgi:hypothetical protein
MDETAVVILNYNGKDFLARFLPGVIQHSGKARIVIADNASTDDSLSYVQSHFPQVQWIQLDQNYGFSKGYNLALQQVKAEYFVLLNSDVEVTPGWLIPLIELLQQSQVAACQPKIRSLAERHKFEYAGAAGGFIDKYGYPFCRGRLFDYLEEDQNQYNDTRSIFWATGACMVVRAKMFWQVGGFDEHFFAHMEEIDLCWRLQHAGNKILYCGQSTVFHVGGGTLNKVNPRKTFLNFRNGLAMLYKNLPPESLWSSIGVRLVLDGVAGIYYLVQGKPAHFMAVIKAHFNFYRNFSFWRQQRQACLRIARGSTLSGVYDQSIVWKFYFEKKKKFSELIF